MYPRGYDEAPGSPVIVLSPHQHQFDPISRAAHSRHHIDQRPAMDCRPHDVPLARGHAKKRSREDDESATAPSAVSTVAASTQSYSVEAPAAAATQSMDNPRAPPCTWQNAQQQQPYQSSQPHAASMSAGTHVHEPILDCNQGMNEVHQMSSNNNVTQAEQVEQEEDEFAPRRHKISRHNTAHDIGDIILAATATTAQISAANCDTNTMQTSSSDAPSANRVPSIDKGKARAVPPYSPLIIDEFTRALGISWQTTVLDEACDDALTQSLRGLQRYLQIFYRHRLTSPAIVARNQQQGYYLVQALEGWFLFDEDLTEARLVAHTRDRALENLAKFPIAFESGESIRPAEQQLHQQGAHHQRRHGSSDEMLVGDMDLD